MSAKARDGHGRWRCKTIGVRVSPGKCRDRRIGGLIRDVQTGLLYVR